MFSTLLRRRRRNAATLALASLVVAGFGTASARAQVNLYVAASIDISGANDVLNFPGQYIGTNPSAVAWNGSTAYIGGYNSSGAVASTGIIAVNVAGGVGSLGAASFGNIATTPNTRGLTSLAVQGTTLAASFDSGAGSADSVRAFNTATNAQLWSIGSANGGNATQRGNGVAFDPGFGGTGQGVAFLAIGGGRRQLLDTATGAYINGPTGSTTPGFIVSSSGTTFRDIAFNPATGDVYARESNRLLAGTRTGVNAVNTPTAIGGLATAATIDNENLAFANGFTGSNGGFSGNFILLNDRTATPAGQAASGVLKAFDVNGTALALNFFDSSGAITLPSGNGSYDFSWNPATQSFAMTDFANRRLYILSSQSAAAVPEPGTLGLLAFGLAGAGGFGLRRRRRTARGV